MIVSTWQRVIQSILSPIVQMDSQRSLVLVDPITLCNIVIWVRYAFELQGSIFSEMIIYKVLQLIGGGSSNEAELIAVSAFIIPKKILIMNIFRCFEIFLEIHLKWRISSPLSLVSNREKIERKWVGMWKISWCGWRTKKRNWISSWLIICFKVKKKCRADLIGWNDVVLGNCFTFNHFNNTARSYLMRSDGAQGGSVSYSFQSSLIFLPPRSESSIEAELWRIRSVDWNDCYYDVHSPECRLLFKSHEQA